jgi:hypothetical protein
LTLLYFAQEYTFSFVKADIALGKAKQVRKTLLEAIAIGKRTKT